MDASATATRAGRYVEQSGGYRAFLPAPLPPDQISSVSSNSPRALRSRINPATKPVDARRAVMQLAAHTGWTLGELLDLDGEDVLAWLGELRAVIRGSRE